MVAGVFTGSVAWWALLTGAIAGLRTRLTPRVVRWLNIASAALIGGFGVDRARHRPRWDDRSGLRSPDADARVLPAAVVFDWDGTLVDTMAMIYRANVASLARVRLTMSRAVVPRALHAGLAAGLPGAGRPGAPVDRDGGPLGGGDGDDASAGDAVRARPASGGCAHTASGSAS